MTVSTVIVGLLATFVYAAVARVTGSRNWALLPALGMALVPAAGSEALANMANLQWWLIPAAFAALLLGPAMSGWQRATAAAVTAPQCRFA